MLFGQSGGSIAKLVRFLVIVEMRYCSLAYSALASFRMGMSGSASFQSGWKSISGYFLFADDPGTTPFVDTRAFVGTNPENAANFCIARRSGGIPRTRYDPLRTRSLLRIGE